MATKAQLEKYLQNPHMQDFLDLISRSEGTHKNGYRTAFGGGRIESLHDHPRYLKTFTQTNGKKNKTSAAGRYQFMRKTWDNLVGRYGFDDFGEHNQDLGAVALLVGRGAVGSILEGDWRKAVKQTGGEWASFASAPDSYHQNKHSWKTLDGMMNNVKKGKYRTNKTAHTQQNNLSQAKINEVYQKYTNGEFDDSPLKKAQYEADVKAGIMQMPKGGKLFAQGQRAKPKIAELPYTQVEKYNNGGMSDLAKAQLHADMKAGIIKLPEGAKLNKQEKKGLIGRSVDKVSDFTGEMLDNVAHGNLDDNAMATIDLAKGVGFGLAKTPLEGFAGLASTVASGVNGDGFNNGYKEGAEYFKNTAMGGFLDKMATPNTELGKKALDIVGIGDDVLKTAGNATYKATGSPLLGAGVEVAGNFLPVSRLKGLKGGVDSRYPTPDAPISKVDIETPQPQTNYANSQQAVNVGGLNGAIDNVIQPTQSPPMTRAVEQPRPDFSMQEQVPQPQVMAESVPVREIPTNSKANFDNVQGKVDVDTSNVANVEHLLDLDRSRPQTGGVAPDVQGLRANVLNELGIPDNGTRKGAITGDIQQLETEKSLSKVDTESGRKMRSLMESEYKVMNDYKTSIIEDSIGTREGLAPEARGQAVIDALDGVKDYYKQKVDSAYKQADEVSQGASGVVLDDFSQILGTNSTWQGKAPNQQLRRGIKSYLKDQNMIDKEGNIKPITVKQAEGIRQYINSQWSHDTQYLIGQVNETIDMGVMKTLPDSAYIDARRVYRQHKAMFDSPNGIAKLLADDGINRKVSAEQVGKNLADLAVKDGKQFEHIYKMLDDLPPELQAQGKRAKAEIQASIAERLLGKKGLKTTNDAYMSYRKRGDDGSYKAEKIFGKDIADKLDNYVAGRNILQHEDPNPSGTATTARNLEAWDKPNIAVEALTDVMSGDPIKGVAKGTGLKSAADKLNNALREKQTKNAFDESVNPKRAETYRRVHEGVVNRVTTMPEVKMLLDEFEKPKAQQNQTKLKVLRAKVNNSKEWQAYVKTLPKKVAKNADVLVLITQGANAHEENKGMGVTF